MTPLKPVTPTRKIAYGIAFFVLFVALWSIATFGGFVSKTFLADPLTMLREGYELFTVHGFLKDIAVTVWRVVGGFVLAAALGVPWASRWAPTSRSRRFSSPSCRSHGTCRHRRSSRCSSCGLASEKRRSCW